MSINPFKSVCNTLLSIKSKLDRLHFSKSYRRYPIDEVLPYVHYIAIQLDDIQRRLRELQEQIDLIDDDLQQ